jgi:hypothetical protein
MAYPVVGAGPGRRRGAWQPARLTAFVLERNGFDFIDSSSAIVTVFVLHRNGRDVRE